MAFLNYISSGNYSVICEAKYNKQSRTASCVLSTFTNSSKVSLVRDEILTLSDGSTCKEFVDNLSTPPGSPVDGDLYLVGTSATGLWAGHEGEAAYWKNATSEWVFIDEPTAVYFKAGSYYKASAGVFYAVEGKDGRVFDDKFTPADIGGASNDLLKTMYVHLKTLAAYSSCTDA